MASEVCSAAGSCSQCGSRSPVCFSYWLALATTYLQLVNRCQGASARGRFCSFMLFSVLSQIFAMIHNGALVDYFTLSAAISVQQAVRAVTDYAQYRLS